MKRRTTSPPPFALSLSKGRCNPSGLRQAQPERTQVPFALSLSKGRRAFLGQAWAGPLALASAPFFAACTDKGAWPEGMAPIAWDRDTCARCSMVISDPRFAVQVRGGPRNEALKFDDIGCAVFLGVERPALFGWTAEPAARWWVAEYGDPANARQRWLDARTAHYLRGTHSPMGYDFAAHAAAQPGTVNFTAMAAAIREMGR